MFPFGWSFIAFLSVVVIVLFMKYRRVQDRLRRAIDERNFARHENNLGELKLAITRYARDHGRVPRSMDVLRGTLTVEERYEFVNPYTGRNSRVNDLTGPNGMSSIEPYDLTFAFVTSKDKASEWCVISIHDDQGAPRRSCRIFAPKAVAA